MLQVVHVPDATLWARARLWEFKFTRPDGHFRFHHLTPETAADPVSLREWVREVLAGVPQWTHE